MTRSIIVDVLLRPAGEDNKCIDAFPSGSPWLELWGNGVQEDDLERDFVAIRSQYVWSASKGEYVTERKFLREWVASILDAPAAPPVEKAGSVTIAHSTTIALYLLDAKRDGADDIRSRSSIWHKLVSEPGLGEEHIAEIE